MKYNSKSEYHIIALLSFTIWEWNQRIFLYALPNSKLLDIFKTSPQLTPNHDQGLISDWLKSQHVEVITSIIKCGMKYLIRFQTAAPLKFMNG